tara:strand:- start:406 stop:585 length:180 start_codon:yes stop_codon:yes gene_type:complete
MGCWYVFGGSGSQHRGLIADSWTARTKAQHNDAKKARAFFLEHADVLPYGKLHCPAAVM